MRVNFGAKLQDNKRDDWKHQYINYDELKKALKPLKSRNRTKWFNKRMAGYEPSDSDEDIAGQVRATARSRSSTTGQNGYPDKESVSGEEARLLPPDATPPAYASIEAGSLLNGTSAMLEEEEDRERRLEGSQAFEQKVRAELQKVESFYRSCVEDMTGRLGTLKVELRKATKDKPAKGKIKHEESGGSTGSPEEGRMRAPSEQKMTDGELLQAQAAWRKRQQAQAPEEREKVAREVHEVQRQLMDIRRETALLDNFCILNFTGFIKIVKKHDKLMPDRPLTKSVIDETLKSQAKPQEEPEYQFSTHRHLNTLRDEVTHVYATLFCHKDHHQAEAELLPKRTRTTSDYRLLHLGYKLGVAATLAVWVVWDCVVQVAKFGHPTVVAKMGFPVFRGVGGLLLLHWCWGLVENCCNWLRINYIYLLDLNPKHVIPPRTIFDHAVNESIVYLSVLLLYYKVLVGNFPDWIPAGYYPLFLLGYTGYCLVTPWRPRMGIWITLARVVCAPLVTVPFVDTLVADMLTSLVKVLLDLVWACCYFTSGDFLRDVKQTETEAGPWSNGVLYTKVVAPLVVILPLWFRFMQCLRRYWDTKARWPHLANAAKYAVAQCVTLFGAFHRVYYHRHLMALHRLGYDSIWFVFTVLSTTFSYLWDVKQDWGLGQRDKKLLNDRRMYSKDYPYYAAIVADLFLRFLWVNTLIPPGTGGVFSIPAYLNAFLMVAEIIRRSYWVVLRMENEQLRNTQGFRRVDVIPLSFATEADHAYQNLPQRDNMKVVLEVSLVAGLVIFLSIGSVVVAGGIVDPTKS